MKHKFYFLILLAAMVLLAKVILAQGTAVNEDGSDPHHSAMLDVKSSDKGFLIPRMTAEEIASLDDPANGLIVFSTTDNKFYAYILSEDIWKEFAYGGSTTPTIELWGMTYRGGANDLGVMFEYEVASDTYIKKHDFDGSNTGQYPYGSLLQSSNGKLYGMTYRGGLNDYGTLFEYDPSLATYNKKLDFDHTNGSRPYGCLKQASNGKLYGMTHIGGTNGHGVLFEYDPASNTYTKKLDFDGSSMGRNPYGSLIQASNGKLYGMTYLGGTNNQGVIFEFDPETELFTLKHSFVNNGVFPYGSLVEASNGKLYGLTNRNSSFPPYGANGNGVLFEFDLNSNTYSILYTFSGGSNGRYPTGSLIEATNGLLYGMTKNGGSNSYNNFGVLFEFNPATDTYTKKFDFDGSSNGSYPFGSLMQASNGKLYGLTNGGGTNDMGVLFEYDPLTDTYIKKLDFDGTNGRHPFYTQLFEVITGGAPAWSCGDILTDPRDSQTYSTVQIGTQCWMAENLNIGTMINGSANQTDNSAIEKYCYNNNTANCDVYGGLYQWNEMMEYVSTEGTQGICPTGWHVPTDAELCILENEVDAGTIDCNSTGNRGIDAGGNLKETGTTHWASPNTGATNTSGFNGLPEGDRNPNGSFYTLTYYARFWSSSESDGVNAWRRLLSYDHAQVYRAIFHKESGISVRCLKD